LWFDPAGRKPAIGFPQESWRRQEGEPISVILRAVTLQTNRFFMIFAGAIVSSIIVFYLMKHEYLNDPASAYNR
jgi:hypothetical protein